MKIINTTKSIGKNIQWGKKNKNSNGIISNDFELTFSFTGLDWNQGKESGVAAIDRPIIE